MEIDPSKSHGESNQRCTQLVDIYWLMSHSKELSDTLIKQLIEMELGTQTGECACASTYADEIKVDIINPAGKSRESLKERMQKAYRAWWETKKALEAKMQANGGANLHTVCSALDAKVGRGVVGQVRLGRWVPGLLHHLRTAGHLGSSAHPASEDGFFFSSSFVCVFPSNHVRAPSHERRRGYRIALGSSASRTSGSEHGDFRLDLCGAWPSLEGDPEVQISVPFPFAHKDLAGGRHRSTAPLKGFGASPLGHKDSARDWGLADLEGRRCEGPSRSGAFQRGSRDRHGDCYVLPAGDRRRP